MPALLAEVVAVGLHRQQDAFRAAASDRAADAALRADRGPGLFGAEHVGRHGHDLGFELRGAGPEVRVQLIDLRLQVVDLVDERDVLVVAVVDRARGEAFLPAVAFGLLELFHLLRGPVRAECRRAESGSAFDTSRDRDASSRRANPGRPSQNQRTQRGLPEQELLRRAGSPSAIEPAEHASVGFITAQELGEQSLIHAAIRGIGLKHSLDAG